MEIDNKLKAPKAIYRTPVAKYRSNNGLDSADLSLIIPKSKGSFTKIHSTILKTTKGCISRFAFQKELKKDFEEIAVKNEIFSILNNKSTWCESFDYKNSNLPISLQSNSDFFDEEYNYFEIKDSSHKGSKNPISKDYNLIDFDNEIDNLSSLSIYISNVEN